MQNAKQQLEERRMLSRLISQEVKKGEQTLKIVRRRVRAMKVWNSLGGVVYEVTLNSLWANEGEKDVTMAGNYPLEELFKRATKEFMKVNHRSDVQARYSVTAALPKYPDIKFAVPEEAWKSYTHHRD